ncbi:MAG TPA: hypothetical protein PLF81_11850 [Candidatus Anammoximicrobium sp.]|nr:hypothetical protein [Candidatus Anammoximicrobium sp.]
MPRQDTRIESEGAEFLVLSQLLIAGIPTFKSYTNTPGYDLVATNPEKNSSARLSVKSRWKTGAEGFIIKNFQCDFVVIAKLNRGSKDGRSKVLPPEFFVLPVEVARAIPRTPGWGKVSFSRVPELEMYRDRWDLIRDFLDVPRSLPPGPTRPDLALEGTRCNRRRARV